MLGKTDEPYAKARAQLEKLQKEVGRIEAERKGLQLALERLQSETEVKIDIDIRDVMSFGDVGDWYPKVDLSPIADVMANFRAPALNNVFTAFLSHSSQAHDVDIVDLTESFPAEKLIAQVDAAQKMPRTDAIEGLLRSVTEPMSRQLISQRLKEMGRSDQPDDISAALNYLKDRGRAKRVGPSEWVSADAETAAAVFDGLGSRA